LLIEEDGPSHQHAFTEIFLRYMALESDDPQYDCPRSTVSRIRIGQYSSVRFATPRIRITGGLEIPGASC